MRTAIVPRLKYLDDRCSRRRWLTAWVPAFTLGAAGLGMISDPIGYF
ncbi:hypothetical protein [[Phormidium] sp. ETS-05]|nr:hypothetical protein [[Phormidium] sp. ETS-05]